MPLACASILMKLFVKQEINFKAPIQNFLCWKKRH